jgi:tetratricopeptide (TPR) repeat protein
LLARLLAFETTSRNEAKDLLFGLLTEARTQPHTDIAVTLAAVAVLGQSYLEQWLRDALAEYGTFLADLILEAAARGFDQAFVAFAAIGRNLQYNDEALFFRIFDQLPFRAPNDVRDDRERAAWGDILLAAAKARSDVQQKNLLIEALRWYDSLVQPQQYHLQQKGQTLFLLDRFDESIAVLEPLVKNSLKPWNRYWLSKSLLATGDSDRALRLIEDALATLPSTRFRSAMLEHRFDVRTSRGDPDAVSDLQEACDLSDNPKYKTALTKRLQGMK